MVLPSRGDAQHPFLRRKIMIYILGLVVGFGILSYAFAVAAAPKNEYERQLEDQEQMEYIAEYKKQMEEYKKNRY